MRVLIYHLWKWVDQSCVKKGKYSQACINRSRGHLRDKEKVYFYDGWPLNRGSIHIKCSMTGQEKGDIEVTTWAGLT